MAETKISGIIGGALEDIKTIIDANTIIGTPIETSAGTTIIPVSKVSVGLASGGVDYESKKTGGNNNFGGGGGSGVQVVPVAFLVVHADGSVEMMNVSNPVSKPADLGYNVSSLVDRAPEIIEKIKALIPKKKPAESASAETMTSAANASAAVAGESAETPATPDSAE
ncbi:MAG: sporulation protein YtfJ [Clostridia bacterium]|nr:sporulation protein YtfJ [Clostridia bacterium]